MINHSWNPLPTVTTVIDADPPNLWVCVLDYVEDVKLKIVAEGTWEWAPGRSCSPNGELGERQPSDLLFASAPLGALIGKIGGSTCDKSEWLAAGTAASGITRPAVFTVGCLGFYAPAKTDPVRGPLFLAMNDSPLRFRYHSGQLTIRIFELES